MTTTTGKLGTKKRGRFAASLGCSEGRNCAADTAHRHDACYGCGQLTCYQGMTVDPETLRRRRRPRCMACTMAPPADVQVQQAKLRAVRTSADWNRVTDPLETSLLRPTMREQYPSRARAALRAFVACGATEMTVDQLEPATLMQSIEVLGLLDEVYAEQRGRTTVLRRVPAPARVS